MFLGSGDPEAARRYRDGSHMAGGQRFFASPELVRRWLGRLPITEVPAKYVVMQPLESITRADAPCRGASSQRSRVSRDTLSYTVPWKLFLRMEADVDASFLGLGDWLTLRDRA